MKNLSKLILLFLLIPQVNFGQTSSAALNEAWSNLSNILIMKNDLIQRLKIICKDSKYVNQEILNKTESNAIEFTKHLKSMNINDKKAIQLANKFNEQITNNLTIVLIAIENDTEIKNSDTSRALLDEIAGTERRIGSDRKIYNNLCIESLNSEMKFDPERQQENAPEVKF